VVHAYSDHSRAQRLFGQGALVELEEGVARMAEWARRQEGPRQSRRFDKIEVEQNLPPSWRE
jgi:UDP-glucose 4-epimerase